MALRPSSADRPTGADLALELCERAQRLLEQGDVAGFGRAVGRLQSIEDRNRRYWAATHLGELGLAASATIPRARRAALLGTLAAALLDMLEREPAEPRLLELAAAVLQGVGSLDGAHALLGAARRLEAPSAGPEPGPGRIAPRAGGVGDAVGFSRRALEIAGRALPAEGLRLSLCMIVRDEQEMLPRCLASVAGAVDEIVIVDTGSTDATVQVARSFGARVIEQRWRDSFAEARNASFDAAAGDWLIYLDADEVLVGADRDLLRSLTGRTWREAFCVSETSHTGEPGAGTAVRHDALRMLRNRPEYRFEGRVHEQIVHRLPTYLPERIEVSDVRIEHYGYLAPVRRQRDKPARNVELLRLQQADGPATPFLHYNLGSEHAAAGEAAAAAREFERAWELLGAEAEQQRFAPTLGVRLAKALRACGRPQEALARAGEGLALFPDFTDLVLEQARAASALGQQERAIGLYERCIAMGDAPRRYTGSVGCGSYLARLGLAELYRARGENGRAIELLARSLREHPRFSASVLPFAEALLATGRASEEVVAEVERYLLQPGPEVRFMLGTALAEAGASTCGEAQFRALLELQPDAAAARVALAETLLAQRRYAEAAREAATVDGNGPLAAAACRSELFARIAGGEQQELARALARAPAAGMAAAEVELFAGWQQLATDGCTEVSPPAELAPQLLVMLEALLRVQDFAAFEVLLGLLERTALPERERRELLAGLYLRRGFAASAAQEWMAVCRTEPDTRALVGLARVAAGRGMTREAGDFAAAALSRDPDSEEATLLLASAQAG